MTDQHKPSRFAAGILNSVWLAVYICSNLLSNRYFLLCVNYFFYGETVTDYFFTLVQREEPLRILSKYHRFISFALYLTGTHTESSWTYNASSSFCFYKCVASSCLWARKKFILSGYFSVSETLSGVCLPEAQKTSCTPHGFVIQSLTLALFN